MKGFCEKEIQFHTVDLTDPDYQIKGLSGFTLSGLMEAHCEKAYLVTTGYNLNMIRFFRE